MESCNCCEGRELDVDNFTPVRLAYNAFEPETGVDAKKPPIIFLHGLSSCKEAWRDVPQIIANETKRKAYAYDARNHGDSEWSDVFHLGQMVQDLFHFMDNVIHAEKAVLVGHSLGGKTAINAVLVKEERFELLVVEDMYVNKSSSGKTQVRSSTLAYMTLVAEAVQLGPPGLDEEQATECIMDYVRSKVGQGQPKEQKPRKTDPKSLGLRQLPDGRYELKANMSVLVRQMSKKSYFPMISPHGTFERPACFIYGELSEFQVPTDAENIYKHFPQAELVKIENASHSVHWDCPKEFTKEVVRFLSTHS